MGEVCKMERIEPLCIPVRAAQVIHLWSLVTVEHCSVFLRVVVDTPHGDR